MEFNLGFRKPKTDMCSRCDALEIAIGEEKDCEERLKLERERNAHQDDAKFAYDNKKKDKEVTFDLLYPIPLLAYLAYLPCYPYYNFRLKKTFM